MEITSDKQKHGLWFCLQLFRLQTSIPFPTHVEIPSGKQARRAGTEGGAVHSPGPHHQALRSTTQTLQLWGLIITVTGRGYSHPELLQTLLSNQEWMNVVRDVPLIQCLAERHFD